MGSDECGSGREEARSSMDAGMEALNAAGKPRLEVEGEVEWCERGKKGQV